jgi:hypothetical protein
MHRFSCWQEGRHEADHQIIRWNGRPQGNISISVAEDDEANRYGHRCDPEHAGSCTQDGEVARENGELDFCYEASGLWVWCSPPVDRTWTQLHRGRTVDDPGQVRRTDQRPTGATRKDSPFSIAPKSDAAVDPRHHTRSASRPGQGKSRCSHALMRARQQLLDHIRLLHASIGGRDEVVEDRARR